MRKLLERREVGNKLILITVIWLAASCPAIFPFCLYLWHYSEKWALTAFKRERDSRIKLQLCMIIRANFWSNSHLNNDLNEYAPTGNGVRVDSLTCHAFRKVYRGAHWRRPDSWSLLNGTITGSVSFIWAVVYRNLNERKDQAGGSQCVDYRGSKLATWMWW